MWEWFYRNQDDYLDDDDEFPAQVIARELNFLKAKKVIVLCEQNVGGRENEDFVFEALYYKSKIKILWGKLKCLRKFGNYIGGILKTARVRRAN